MKNVSTSRQYTVNVRDVIRGLILGIIVAAFPVIQEAVDTWVNGGNFVINFRQLVDVSWKSAVGYITLNFFSNSKIIATPEKGADIDDKAHKVKGVL